MKHYAERDLMTLGQYYTDHVDAMTAEELHSKSDIAAELAHRDMLIDKWDSRELGASEEHVEVASPEEQAALERALSETPADDTTPASE